LILLAFLRFTKSRLYGIIPYNLERKTEMNKRPDEMTKAELLQLILKARKEFRDFTKTDWYAFAGAVQTEDCIAQIAEVDDYVIVSDADSICVMLIDEDGIADNAASLTAGERDLLWVMADLQDQERAALEEHSAGWV
jgi:hypothetical protein